ncbi:MAG: AAA family ATPase [Rubrivivax sp.]
MATRLLERELAVPLNGELSLQAASLRAPGGRAAPPPPPLPWQPPAEAAASAAPGLPKSAAGDEPQAGASPAIPIVGRERERENLERALLECRQARLGAVRLILGEPGIGKTRLLDHVAERAERGGMRVLKGRGFEAEMVRPYGAWIDALRPLSAGEVPPHLHGDLAALLPHLGTGVPAQGDRARLFDSVASLLQTLADGRPLVLLFDDTQWLDEASLALLHFVARTFFGRRPALPWLLASAARAGEIDDNRALARVRRSLEREGRIEVIEVGPLDAGETEALVHGAYPNLAAADLVRGSGGVPLFALELARARAGGHETPEVSLDALIAGELARLHPRLRELVQWAAAYGREIAPELLGSAADVPPPELALALHGLEGRGLLRPGAAGLLDFAHDLIRQATYRAVSQPRRRLLHRGLARALEAAAADEPALLADLAHHAALAEEPATAALAFAGAADRCLKLFANADALDLTTRGLAQAERLAPGAERSRAEVTLLRTRYGWAVRGPRRRAAWPRRSAGRSRWHRRTDSMRRRRARSSRWPSCTITGATRSTRAQRCCWRLT